MKRIDNLDVGYFIEELFVEKLPPDMTYHNLIHTEHVVNQAKVIGKKSGLSAGDMDVVVTAAWFHDSGFTVTYEGHEEESKKIAQKYLEGKGIPQEVTDRVLQCIDSTRVPQDPGDDLLAMVLCDADMSYVAENFYADRTMLLLNEWNTVAEKCLSKQAYLEETIALFEQHRFFTEYGRNVLAPGKEINYQRLKELLAKAEKKAAGQVKKLESENKKLQEKLKKDKLPGRGVESMFRLTARNQINLSSIADNKANILITVITFMLPVLGYVGVGRLQDYPDLILPVIVFSITCVVTLIIAIMSTRPKISSGKFTKEDILARKVNLMFFGNFYNMEFEEYLWAVKEMMKDDDHLYTNMIMDQYSLGKVISRKYRLLRVAYTIFMIGIILSVIIFAITLILPD